MKLSPEQANATTTYYAWRCMQLEVQASGMQQLIEQQQAELQALRQPPEAGQAIPGGAVNPNAPASGAAAAAATPTLGRRAIARQAALKAESIAP